MSNQKALIKESKTIQSQKKTKGPNNDLQTTTQKTKD